MKTPLHLFLSLVMIFGATMARAQTSASTVIPDTTFSLNGTWQFALAATGAEADALADFHKPGFNGENFTPSPVPSNWSVLGYEEPVYRGFKDDKAGEGFYLHDFTPPKNWNDKRVLLHFGGVWSSAEVWLNGVRLGRHDSGYTSFSFDITGKFKAGESNRLAVRVRQITREYKFDVYDDWTLGGIYRDVSLEAMPQKRWIDSVVVQTVFDDLFRDADLRVRAMVGDRHKNTLPGNYPSPGESYDLRVTLSTNEGIEIARQQLTVPAHTATDRELRLTLRAQSPRHWNAETPYLYNLRVDLLEKGEITHTRTERVGFRQISTDGGVFRINGQAVKLRGVNRHDEHPDVGRATTRKHWLQDITLMKVANINFIRLAHYTPTRGFIELCDELGMYVGNEVSIGGAGDLMYDPSFSAAALQRAHETVVRDINSPSIVYWSVGNEDPLTSIHMASVKLVKALDPTRPVLLPWRWEEWLPPEIDMLAPHYWHPREYDRLAGRANRPIITTEYTHAYGTDGFGGLEARWRELTKHPAGAGGAIWLWADQGIKTPVQKPKGKSGDRSDGDEYMRLDSAGWDGIVDAYRNSTRDYLETKAVYAQVYPAMDKITFTPGEASARIPIQNDYDFTDLDTVKIAWSIREDENELACGSGSISGQPHSVSAFKLPLEKLKTIHAGKTYYAWFIFTGADGAEITRKAVELVPLAKPSPRISTPLKLTVSQGESVTVTAGGARYVFDPKIGRLVSAALHDKTLITDLRPVIWRKLDDSEVSVVGRRAAREASDLNRYTASATTWDVTEENGRVAIHAKVDYSIDEKNRFATTYDYEIGADGGLEVRYEILPEVTVPCVPIVGMVVQSAPELGAIRWLGLGPDNAYPNKRSAPILGVWGGAAGSADVAGTKAMRWLERTGAMGGFRISNVGYFEHDTSAPDTVRILSGVAARPEKGRKADDDFPQLATGAGKPLVGSLKIELKGND
ncbi:glycoside hydrolase family 2 TIM barrel-domain containing protein [Ereboglobus sp. PH5-10]|uniref:glycoside hydrolase family 2 TIM barrel-domain containing protein n=1 Tax=Ereboglobus sp. PH5-10 TaxID=2940629 RepID=UPI0024065BF6|nr:glycoside hydrolase family 2 TIM barrel-domain containing protein [Ereboglobus sp. PH5-10]